MKRICAKAKINPETGKLSGMWAVKGSKYCQFHGGTRNRNTFYSKELHHMNEHKDIGKAHKMKHRCEGFNHDGKTGEKIPCPMYTAKGSKYCRFHESILRTKRESKETLMHELAACKAILSTVVDGILLTDSKCPSCKTKYICFEFVQSITDRIVEIIDEIQSRKELK